MWTFSWSITHFTIAGIEKIYNFFVVQFHELCCDFEFWGNQAIFPRMLYPWVHAVEKLMDGSWYDADLTFSNVNVEAGTHCICLPGTCLSIS